MAGQDLANIYIGVDSSELAAVPPLLNKTEVAYAQMAARVEREQRAVERANKRSTDVQVEALRRLQFEQQRSTHYMSRFGQATQQAGYQFGDFIVQVQSGTNAWVAAGQQLTQLAGLMYLSNVAWMTIAGTVASIAIPLVTAIGAYYSRTEDAIESTDRFTESLKKLERATYDLQRAQDAVRLGVSEEEVDVQIRLTSLLGQRAAVERSIEQAAGATNTIARYQAQLDIINEQIPKLEEILAKYRELNKLADSRQRLEKLVSIAWEQSLEDAKKAEEVARKTAANAGSLARGLADAKATASGFVGVADNLAGALGRAAAAWGAILTGPITGAPGAIARYEASGSADAAARNNAITMGKAGGLLAGGAGGIRDFGSGGGGGGGDGSNPIEQEVEAIRSFLQTEAEIELEAYQQKQDTLRSALEQRLITIQEFNELEKELKIKHNEEMTNIDVWRYGNAMDQTEAFLGGLADALSSGNDRMLRASRIFAASEALISAWRAYSKALAEGNYPTPFARLAAALPVLKAGLGAVAAIRGGGSSSTGGGAGSVGRVQSTRTAAAQTVYIEGLTPDALFSGQMLTNLFEGIYKENDNRGKVFVVAR